MASPPRRLKLLRKRSNVRVASCRSVTTPKGEYLAANVRRRAAGGRDSRRAAAEGDRSHLLGEEHVLAQPERAFVRPVRWLVAMLDGEVVPLEFAGFDAGNQSRGHRILTDRRDRRLPAPGDYYVEALRTAKVIAIRRARAAHPQSAGRRHPHRSRCALARRQALLDTVVNLTEWPSVILGSFDPEFLALPEEVLVTVMRDHQKYFALEDASGKLLPHFLAVLNTDGDPDGIIRHGNERVLRARFNDARFFWQTDQKIPLRERVQLLKAVTFQKDLGSYYDKTMRVQWLASWLSEIIKQPGSGASRARAQGRAVWRRPT